ncbi:MAG: hypothetical protein JNL70_13745 [Saprospiraceae bacterium]|nr:hypothetical protein [Saprospiraceae bacterium]
MKKKLIIKVEKHKVEQNMARCTFSFEEHQELVRGYILDYSEQLIVFQECDNFMIQPYGYKILPIKNLEALRFNKFDRFCDFIYKSEEQTQYLHKPQHLKLDNWRMLFEELQANSKTVIVEHLVKGDFVRFTIGKIISIQNKSVKILNFDAAGVWDEKTTNIKFKNIWCANFDDSYSVIFSKYVK